MGKPSSALQKFNALGTVINTIQLRSQGKSVTALSRELELNTSALIHVSSQLQGIGEMSVMTLVGISELDAKLVAIGKHFHAVEVREETWSSMRDRLIDLDDTMEEIEEHFEEFPVYSMFCLEVLEALADKNGIEKENFRYRDDKVDVNAFRKRIKATKRLFNSSLRDLELIPKFNEFKGLLQEYHNKTEELRKERSQISKSVKLLKDEKIPDPRKGSSDNYPDQIDEEVSQHNERIAELEDLVDKLGKKRKEEEARYIEKRKENPSYQELRSIKVDLDSLHPIASWNKSLDSKLKSRNNHAKGILPVEKGVNEKCCADVIKLTKAGYWTGRRLEKWIPPKYGNVRCTRPASRRFGVFCFAHNNDKKFKMGKYKIKSFEKLILAEKKAGKKLRQRLGNLEAEISKTLNLVEKSRNLIGTKEEEKKKFVQHRQQILSTGEKAEELSGRLDVIENKLSLHLPLDVSPSDLQS